MINGLRWVFFFLGAPVTEHLAGHLPPDLAQGRELGGGEAVDEDVAHRGDVPLCRSDHLVPAGLREGGHRAAPVVLSVRRVTQPWRSSLLTTFESRDGLELDWVARSLIRRCRPSAIDSEASTK